MTGLDFFEFEFDATRKKCYTLQGPSHVVYFRARRLAYCPVGQLVKRVSAMQS
jgi:hypothetical protein